MQLDILRASRLPVQDARGPSARTQHRQVAVRPEGPGCDGGSGYGRAGVRRSCEEARDGEEHGAEGSG